MCQKKVLVLGATGAMGKYLIPKLAAQGYKIDAVALDDYDFGCSVNLIKAQAKDFAFRTQLLQNKYDGIVDFNNNVTFNEEATFGNGITVNDSSITVSNGNVTSSGGFFDTSDERVKNFGENINVDLDKLSSLKKAYFRFNDNRDDNLTHIGVSAQEIKELYPEIVREYENGMLTVDYSKLSVVALEAVDILYKKNKELEERLNKIEQILGC
jgi:NAD(P)-dependent dehydrogenase (short-subunit alcohol dehydrogenase family)